MQVLFLAHIRLMVHHAYNADTAASTVLQGVHKVWVHMVVTILCA